MAGCVRRIPAQAPGHPRIGQQRTCAGDPRTRARSLKRFEAPSVAHGHPASTTRHRGAVPPRSPRRASAHRISSAAPGYVRTTDRALPMSWRSVATNHLVNGDRPLGEARARPGVGELADRRDAVGVLGRTAGPAVFGRRCGAGLQPVRAACRRPGSLRGSGSASTQSAPPALIVKGRHRAHPSVGPSMRSDNVRRAQWSLAAVNSPTARSCSATDETRPTAGRLGIAMPPPTTVARRFRCPPRRRRSHSRPSAGEPGRLLPAPHTLTDPRARLSPPVRGRHLPCAADFRPSGSTASPSAQLQPVPRRYTSPVPCQGRTAPPLWFGTGPVPVQGQGPGSPAAGVGGVRCLLRA